MRQSNLAVTFPEGGEPESKQQPRLKLVTRILQEQNVCAATQNCFVDKVDTLILTLALAAGILAYTAFGVLAVAGK